MEREAAKATLLYWHHWWVEIRAHANDADATLAGMRAAMAGIEPRPLRPADATSWVDGDDYEPEAVAALVSAFRRLCQRLLMEGLPVPQHRFRLFDALEVLPLELMRLGPRPVERALDGADQEELVVMASRFRRRPGRVAEPEIVPREAPSRYVERVSAHLREAMKRRDRHRMRALRLVKVRVVEAERFGMNDATYRTILAQMLERVEETIGQFAKAGREDLADAEVAEAAVYEELLAEWGDVRDGTS